VITSACIISFSLFANRFETLRSHLALQEQKLPISKFQKTFCIFARTQIRSDKKKLLYFLLLKSHVSASCTNKQGDFSFFNFLATRFS